MRIIASCYFLFLLKLALVSDLYWAAAQGSVLLIPAVHSVASVHHHTAVNILRETDYERRKVPKLWGGTDSVSSAKHEYLEAPRKVGGVMVPCSWPFIHI